MAWKSLLQEPRSLSWSEFPVENLEVFPNGLAFEKETIYINSQELRSLALRLFKEFGS